jgi:hypothetical protein
METLHSMVSFMLLMNHMRETMKERKGEEVLAVVTENERSKASRLGRQMLGKSLMALGLRLSGMGKRLLEETL